MNRCQYKKVFSGKERVCLDFHMAELSRSETVLFTETQYYPPTGMRVDENVTEFLIGSQSVFAQSKCVFFLSLKSTILDPRV